MYKYGRLFNIKILVNTKDPVICINMGDGST